MITRRTGPPALTDDVPHEPLAQLPLVVVAAQAHEPVALVHSQSAAGAVGMAHEPSAHWLLTSVNTAGLMMDFFLQLSQPGQAVR